MAEELQTVGEQGVTTGGYEYNPQDSIKKAGAIQNLLMDEISKLNMGDLLDDPKKMEQVNSLLANVNTTAVQVTRNAIVESNTDISAQADAFVDRMIARGISTIRTVESSGTRGRIPTDVNISDADFEEIQPGMLQRGLVEQVYDDFAEANGLAKTDDS